MKNRIPVFLALAAAFAACAHARPKTASTPEGAATPSAAKDAGPGLPAPAQSETAAVPEPSVRGSLMHGVLDLQAVRFDYDSAALSAPTRATLRKNAEWIKAHPELKVQVAGHCDQRGTEEYNLALGQRRADSVRQYYLMIGVPAEQVATISYGKNKLLCERMDEACWRQNRRAETLAAMPQAMSKAGPR